MIDRRDVTHAAGRQALPALGVLALLFAALSYWSGLPPAETLPAFVLGVAVMISLLVGFGLLLWHLLLRPLPAGHRAPALVALPVAQRRLIALLIVIAALNIVVGGFWDEVWHRQYGLPFGDDLFWRPHLMLYFGLLLVVGLGGLSLYWLLRRGRGTLQQRFRAMPTLGLLALLGGFMLYALPADPIWHTIYGADISAWSLPHLILLFCVMLIALLAAAIYLTTVPEARWRGLRDWRGDDSFVLLALTWLLLVLIQVLATEWDNIPSPAAVAQMRDWNRPDWLLPILLVLGAGFAGALANHAARRVGMATLSGATALAGRWLMVVAFGYDGMSINGWVAALPLFVALDVLYAAYLRRGRVATLPAAAGALTLGVLPTLLLIGRLYAYPVVDARLVLVTLPIAAAVALGALWLGRLVGDSLATRHKQLATAVEPPSSTLRYAVPAAALGVLVFIVFFVLTATPPV